MKFLKVFVFLFFALVVVPIFFTNTAETQSTIPVTEAPTGFDNLTNGFTDQATMDADRGVFEDREGISDGLGPIYNAQSCAECHQNPVSGGISQVTVLRAGHLDAFGNFVNPRGERSLINDRAIFAGLQERVPGTETVRTFRTSLNTLGDGFVECIDSNTLLAIANSQPGQSGGLIAGQFITVPVAEAGGAHRGGRFGLKNQQASLLSFASDAYLNEMGITNRLNPNENTFFGTPIPRCSSTVTTNCDPVADPEDVLLHPGDEDLDKFARFMRATKAPPRDAALAATSDAVIGSALFDQIGCNICHVRNITTAPPGTKINGGAFTVPNALGNKIIHPFSDFLLHNNGTGDGIVQNGGPSTMNKVRTAPLWGVRTRDRLMHDGATLTRNEAILRHAGEATFVINNYRALSTTQKSQLITFLNSL